MLEINEKKCLNCSGCPATCPEMALLVTRSGLRVDQKLCTLCKICVRFCPVGALGIVAG